MEVVVLVVDVDVEVDEVLDVLVEEVLVDDEVLVVGSGGGKVCGTGGGAGGGVAGGAVGGGGAVVGAGVVGGAVAGGAVVGGGSVVEGSPCAIAGVIGVPNPSMTERTAATRADRRTHRGARERSDMIGVGNATGPTPGPVDAAAATADARGRSTSSDPRSCDCLLYTSDAADEE